MFNEFVRSMGTMNKEEANFFEAHCSLFCLVEIRWTPEEKTSLRPIEFPIEEQQEEGKKERKKEEQDGCPTGNKQETHPTTPLPPSTASCGEHTQLHATAWQSAASGSATEPLAGDAHVSGVEAPLEQFGDEQAAADDADAGGQQHKDNRTPPEGGLQRDKAGGEHALRVPAPGERVAQQQDQGVLLGGRHRGVGGRRRQHRELEARADLHEDAAGGGQRDRGAEVRREQDEPAVVVRVALAVRQPRKVHHLVPQGQRHGRPEADARECNPSCDGRQPAATCHEGRCVDEEEDRAGQQEDRGDDAPDRVTGDQWVACDQTTADVGGDKDRRDQVRAGCREEEIESRTDCAGRRLGDKLAESGPRNDGEVDARRERRQKEQHRELELSQVILWEEPRRRRSDNHRTLLDDEQDE